MTTAVYRFKNDPLLISGPCCVLLSIAVASFLPTAFNAYLPWLALTGMALCWKFALKGLGGMLLLTAALVTVEGRLSIWDIGIYISLGSAWCAIALAVDRELELPSQTDPGANQVQMDLIAQQHEEMRAQQSLLERLRKELITQVEKNQQNSLAAVQLETQRRLTADLEFQVVEVQKEAATHRQDVQKYKGLHTQLREQFELKSQQLDESRHRLFQVEEELNSLLNEMKEAEFAVKTPWLRDLEQLLEHSEAMYNEELERLRRENQLLEEIISSSNSSKQF